MKKFKLFIENFFVYGFGGIISKIIPLIMVPIITRIMPNTEYYGISDLSNTLVNFASSIAIMGMYDAMYRMFFEKDEKEYKKRVCSTAIFFTLGTSVVVFFIMILFRNKISGLFFDNPKYAYVVYLSAMATLVGATNSIISAPTRMQNQRAIFLITNTISPILSYAIAIPLLLKGYFIIALPLAAVISNALMELSFGILNKEWFSIKDFDKTILPQLLTIAIPLLPVFVIYWLFNSLSKVMITNMIGVGAAGIYSVGSKFGQVSQLIYQAFAGGWQYFAFSTMKEENQVKNNSLIFEYLGIISFIATSFVCAISFPLMKLLFTEDYTSAYVTIPYLFLSPLLLMLFQVACNQFLVIKKTWPNLIILGAGAIFCILGNIILIPMVGIEGAAISTLIGYAVSVILCAVVLAKMKLMDVSFKFLVSSLIMILVLIGWRLIFSKNVLLGIPIALVVTSCFMWIYSKDIKNLINMIKNRKAKHLIK